MWTCAFICLWTYELFCEFICGHLSWCVKNTHKKIHDEMFVQELLRN